MNRILPCLLALMSGLAALSHQVLWTRRLVDLLGAGPDTFSKVIGVFFVGLALGAWLAGTWLRRRVATWRSVAVAELAVGALALPALFSYAAVDWSLAGGFNGELSRIVITLLLVMPPATAMGTVLPLMISALADARQPAITVWLYGWNTLGGVLGLALTLGFSLPTFGLTGAAWLAVAVNVFIAVAAAIMSRGKPLRREAPATHEQRDSSPMRFHPVGKLFVVGGVSGFLTLGAEVVLQHQFAQVAINAHYSGAVVLAMVLVALGLGAFLAAKFFSGDRMELGIKLGLLLGGVLALSEPFVFTAMRGGVQAFSYELTPLVYSASVLGLGLMTIVPAFLALGLVFPLLLRQLAGTQDTPRIGVLLAWNGLGGWLGTELVQMLVTPHLGLWQSMLLIGSLAFAAGLLLAARDWPKPALVAGVPALLAVCALVLLAGGKLPQVRTMLGETVHEVRVGREGVVTTIERGPDDWQMLFNNGYTLGGSRARLNQERQALLPQLLHGDARSVAVLGFATGSTVAGATLGPFVESVETAELSPLVLAQARRYFTPFNRDVFHDPRVKIFTADARSLVAGAEAKYDVVVGDLFLPWRTGEGRLFAREHFMKVRRALKDDGLFCQWLPMFQLTRPQFEVIARTFREVFHDAFLVRGDFYVELPIIGLVGGCHLEELDWERIAANCARVKAAGLSTDPLVRHPEGVAMLLLGPLPKPTPGPVNTLGNAWIEWDAGNNVVGLREPWFIGTTLGEFVRAQQQRGAPLLPAELRPVQQAGDFFLTLEMAAKLQHPMLKTLQEQIPRQMPEPLRVEVGVDWNQWPSRVKPGPFSSARQSE